MSTVTVVATSWSALASPHSKTNIPSCPCAKYRIGVGSASPMRMMNAPAMQHFSTFGAWKATQMFATNGGQGDWGHTSNVRRLPAALR